MVAKQYSLATIIHRKPTQSFIICPVKTSEFMRKLACKSLWMNLVAMAAVIVFLILGTELAMNIYTHHGESISVPDVRKHSYEASLKVLEDLGFEVIINDTGYVKNLPPGTILDQLPTPGTKVKSGRIIYLTVNATDSPTLIMPDIIDNCSLREAMARLTALGFKLGQTQFVPGEKDWVYGILVNGKNVSAGDRISIESKLIIQAGNGQRDAADSIYMTDTHDDYYESEEYMGEENKADATESRDNGDDFEIVE